VVSTRIPAEFNPLPAGRKSRMMTASWAAVLMTVLLGPNAGNTQAKTDDPVYAVRVINRSITKLQVTVWDENQSHKSILNTTMGAGAELSLKAVAKIEPAIREHGPGTHISWKVVALDDQGFPFKPGAKAPTRCGGFLSFKDNERFEVSPYNNVKGVACP